jgi:SAM-dependent methyltransferase
VIRNATARQRFRRLPPIAQLAAWKSRHVAEAVVGAAHWAASAIAYRRMPGAEPLRLRDLYPALRDRTSTSPFDAHYFFQDVWAIRHVAAARPGTHVDVGSRVDFVGFLTALTEVVFVDIRPLPVNLEGLTSLQGSVTNLPFADASLESVSCLHVAEHVGLGRYGDPLDPHGTLKAAQELQRVLGVGGQLLFSLPVGKPRLCFNAHRVHDPRTVVEMFRGVVLRDFAAVTDDGDFRMDVEPGDLARARYACGLYRFARI